MLPLPKPKANGDQGPNLSPAIKNIIAVLLKGGVGKIYSNSQIWRFTLAKMGFKVGLVGLLIFTGPSMPIMFDVTQEKPSIVKVEGKIKN